MPGHDHGFTEMVQGSVIEGHLPVVEAFTEDFPWEKLNTLDGELMEIVEAGGSPMPLIRQTVERMVTEAASEALMQAICLISDSENERLTVDALAWATRSGEPEPTAAEFATRNRISERAFLEEAQSIAEAVGISRPGRAAGPHSKESIDEDQ